jgi:hypothetical protein
MQLFWGAPKTQNKSKFFVHRLPKVCTDDGRMRAGGQKRPARPMNALKFSELAITDSHCDAQILLNLYAFADDPLRRERNTNCRLPLYPGKPVSVRSPRAG